MYHDYLETQPKIIRLFMRIFTHYLRVWDYVSAARVDYFVANSKFVAKRIKKYYGREAEIIYPPVNTQEFKVSSGQEDYYLASASWLTINVRI